MQRSIARLVDRPFSLGCRLAALVLLLTPACTLVRPAAQPGAAPAVALPSPVADDPALVDAMEKDVDALRNVVESELAQLDRKLVDIPVGPETANLIQSLKVFMRRQADAVLAGSDPRQELLGLWAMAEQLKGAVASAEAGSKLGAAHDPVLTATGNIHQAILATARRYLPESAINQAAQSIGQSVQSNPLSLDGLMGVGQTGVNSLVSLFNVGKDTLGAIASVPLLPQRTVQGIQQGTDQFAQFNVTAERFTNIIDNLPTRLRTETDQFLASIADRQTTLSALLNDLRLTADSFARTAEQASVLVPQVDEAVGGGADAAEAFRQTADAVEKASLATNELVVSVQRLIDSQQPAPGAKPGASGGFDPRQYEAAALAIQEGSAEVTRTLKEVQKLIELSREHDQPTTAPQNQGRPFDVLDYQTSADSLATASLQLRLLLQEVSRQAGSSELEATLVTLREQVRPAVDHSADRANDVIDHLAWRLAQVLILAFGLGVCWLLLRRWLAPAKP